MKKAYKAASIAAICMISIIAPPLVRGQDAATASAELPRENVQLVLGISTTNQPTVSYAIVCSGNKCRMNGMAGMVDIDGKQVPVVMSFEVSMTRTDASSYGITYYYSLQIPVVTGHDPNGT